jgi:hypothetical protein
MGLEWAFRSDAARKLEAGHTVIINLDDRCGKGTHWVSAKVINGTLCYADPLGSTLGGYPPHEFNKFGVPVVSAIPFQRPNTALCGYYAVCFGFALDAYQQSLGPHDRPTQKDLEEVLMLSIT